MSESPPCQSSSLPCSPSFGPRLALGFHLHLSHRLRPFSYFDIGRHLDYFDDVATRAVLAQTLAEIWRPALDALDIGAAGADDDFRFYLALSGTLLDQLSVWAPEELDRLRRLADSGRVEFVVTPVSQSLAALHAPLAEFIAQVCAQRDQIHKLFGVVSSTFRNTGLLYDDAIARCLDEAGFRATLAPAHTRLLGWHKLPRIFAAAPCPKLRVLPCNLTLAARFESHSLSVAGLPQLDHCLDLLTRVVSHGDGFCLDLPLVAFGGSSMDDRGRCDYLRAIRAAVPARTPFRWALPAELAASSVSASVSAPETISSEAPACDDSPWIGSTLQRDAFETLYALEEHVRVAHDPELTNIWRKLQDAVYLRAMDPSTARPGATPAGASPYDAYMLFMNMLADFETRI